MMSSRPSVVLLTKNGYARPRDGGTLRVSAVHRTLRSMGYEVIPVAADEGGGLVSELRALLRHPLGNLRVLISFARIGSLTTLRWYRPRITARLIEITRSRATCAVVEYSQMWAYRSALPDHVHLDMHNVEAELLQNYAKSAKGLRKLIASYESHRVRSLERRIMRQVNSVSVVSERDRATLSKLTKSPGRPNIVVATNGVSDDAFLAKKTHTTQTAVFVAHLGWAPNVDGALWLAEHVWPIVTARLPHARLQLVGRDPARRVKELACRSIEVHPNVESTFEYIANARVATAPLQAAGGTRLKILEALACGTPVVATRLGALGLEHLDGEFLSIRDEAQAFAARMIQLLETDNHRADSARELARPYRWSTALDPLASAVRTAFGGNSDV